MRKCDGGAFLWELLLSQRGYNGVILVHFPKKHLSGKMSCSIMNRWTEKRLRWFHNSPSIKSDLNVIDSWKDEKGRRWCRRRKKTTDKIKVSIMICYIEVFQTMPIRWEQVNWGNLEILLTCRFLQLPLWDPEAFPGNQLHNPIRPVLGVPQGLLSVGVPSSTPGVSNPGHACHWHGKG